MTDEVQQTTNTPAEETVQLQLQDLLLLAQVVQVASQRGAIKAEEMETVGGVYSRLVKFLQASGAIQPAQQAEAPAEETPADTPAE